MACGDTPEVRELARRAPCRTLLYGITAGGEGAAPNEVRPLAAPVALPAATRFRVADAQEGEIEIELLLAGGHNVANALAVWAAARRDGLPAAASGGRARPKLPWRRAPAARGGSAGGVLVIDDFAHHPTAVAKTLEALRQRYPGRRLVALFEPRSLTAGRTMFFDAYRQAFAAADRVLFAPTFHHGRLSPEERLDFTSLAAALSRDGVVAACTDGLDDLLARAAAESRSGDVLVTMSSGAFGDLPRRLLAALTAAPPPLP